MSETKSKNNGVDHSSSTMRKEKAAMSKKEMKIFLIAQRMAMLDDDHETLPVLSQDTPVQSKSNKLMNISDDKLLVDNVISKFSQNRKNYGSHKRVRVIDDDDKSLDISEPIACIQPRKKGSHKRERVENDAEFPVQDKELNAYLPSSQPKRSSSIKRAEKVQANLSAKYPSFIKFMLRSHVSGCFWLGLPTKFCDAHLPLCDTIMVLVDEAGQEFSTNYLPRKTGLSGGWRGFSIYHDLLPGDALVFQLIAPTKFKVYIVREQHLKEVGGALELICLDSTVGKQKSEDNTQKVLQTEDTHTLVDDIPQSCRDKDLGSDLLDGICVSDSAITIEGLKDFKDFSIVVDDFVMDSKFSDSTRKKYYELCINQRCLLHEKLHKGLNCNLVVGIVSEVVNIADAINSGSSSTSHEDLRVWEKTLEGFEFLGMKVGFMLTRLRELLGLVVEGHTAVESSKLKETIIKQVFAAERMKALENKLSQLKETMHKIDLDMENEMKMESAWKREAKCKEISAVL